jgi:hypothetical protein
MGPALLLTSELVTNAVIHANTDVELRTEVAGDVLRIEVLDRGAGCPTPIRAPPDAEWGRGLTILSAVAHRWGVVMERSEKLVWAELRCPSPSSRRERRLLFDGLASQVKHFTRRLPHP